MKILICVIAFVAGLMVTVKVNPDHEKAVEPGTKILNIEPLVADGVVPTASEPSTLGIERQPYGVTKSGTAVTQFVCTNANGLSLELIDFGATITSIKTPDKNGEFADITLHCSDMAGYEACSSNFGSTIGRYSKQIWNATEIQGDDWVGVRFTFTNQDDDSSYHGKLVVRAWYVLNNDNEVIVEMEATTDRPTHLIPTNHNFWNLGGVGSGSICDHLLKLDSNQFLPVDSAGIRTGELADVYETPFDFTIFHTIGSRFEDIGGEPIGYDHGYKLRNQSGRLALAATVKEPMSGRTMEFHTNQAGIQLYSGNFLNGQPGSGGFAQHHGFCLETQQYHDSPSLRGCSFALLTPEKRFHQKSVYKFGVAK